MFCLYLCIALRYIDNAIVMPYYYFPVEHLLFKQTLFSWHVLLHTYTNISILRYV